jgi:hypothetical protein
VVERQKEEKGEDEEEWWSEREKKEKKIGEVGERRCLYTRKGQGEGFGQGKR